MLSSQVWAQTALYTVLAGDSLYRIAKAHGVTPDELMRLNNLPNDRIAIGQLLYVPQGSSAQTTQVSAQASSFLVVRSSIITHLVSQQESLNSLSNLYSLSVSTLMRSNPELDFASEDAPLSLGVSLYIPPSEGRIIRLTEEQQLLFVAIDADMSVAALASANAIGTSEKLEPGKRIYLPDPEVVEAFLQESNPNLADPHFIWPIHGPITSFYGQRNISVGGNTFHAGVDIAAPMGTPILAAKSGTVSRSGWGGGYGYVIYIEHSDGSQTRYAHMSNMAVKEGVSVHQGDTIGYVGTTGASTGPHLHFEIRQGEKSINPLSYLPTVEAKR